MQIKLLTTFACGHSHLEEKQTSPSRYSVRTASPLVLESRARECPDCENMKEYNEYFKNLSLSKTEADECGNDDDNDVEKDERGRERFKGVFGRLRWSRRLCRMVRAIGRWRSSGRGEDCLNGNMGLGSGWEESGDRGGQLSVDEGGEEGGSDGDGDGMNGEENEDGMDGAE